MPAVLIYINFFIIFFFAIVSVSGFHVFFPLSLCKDIFVHSLVAAMEAFFSPEEGSLVAVERFWGPLFANLNSNLDCKVYPNMSAEFQVHVQYVLINSTIAISLYHIILPTFNIKLMYSELSDSGSEESLLAMAVVY